MSIPDINQRWEQGIDHDPRSTELATALRTIDEANGDMLDLRFGGDGDNGEHLLYLLDIYFAQKDAAQPVFACHVDLDPDMEPDECVLPHYPERCVYAERLVREGKGKESCEYWQPITVCL